MNFDFIEDPELRKKAEDEYAASMQELKDGFKATLEETVLGLKTKNTELLDEKKKIQETLKDFDNLDVEKAREALSFLEDNDDAQMIKDGKIDELIEKRTSTLRSEHEEALSALAAELVTSTGRGDKYAGLYKGKMVDDSLIMEAQKASVLPAALADVLLHGRGIFSLGDDDSVESRDAKGELVKTADDKILTPKLWVEARRTESPHWWPNSSGAGAFGSGSSASDMDAALLNAAKKGDQKEYNRLRAIQRAG